MHDACLNNHELKFLKTKPTLAFHCSRVECEFKNGWKNPLCMSELYYSVLYVPFCTLRSTLVMLCYIILIHMHEHSCVCNRTQDWSKILVYVVTRVQSLFTASIFQLHAMLQLGRMPRVLQVPRYSQQNYRTEVITRYITWSACCLYVWRSYQVLRSGLRSFLRKIHWEENSSTGSCLSLGQCKCFSDAKKFRCCSSVRRFNQQPNDRQRRFQSIDVSSTNKYQSIQSQH